MDQPPNPEASQGAIKRIAAKFDELGLHGMAAPRAYGVQDNEELKEWLGGRVVQIEQRLIDRTARESSPPPKLCSPAQQPMGTYRTAKKEPVDNPTPEICTGDTMSTSREQSTTNAKRPDRPRTIPEKDEGLQAQYNAAKTQTKKIADEHRESEERVMSLREHVNTLQAEKKRLLLAINCSDKQIVDLQSQIADLRSQLLTAQEKEKNLQKKLQDAQSREGELHKQLTAARNSAYKYREQEQELKFQIRGLQLQHELDQRVLALQKLQRARAEDLESENYTLHQECQKLKSENSKLCKGKRRVVGINRNFEAFEKVAAYMAT